MNIPFLKPDVVKLESYAQCLNQMDESRIYSNYGPLNQLFEQRIIHEVFQDIGHLTTVNNATTGLMLAISESKRPKGKYALMPSFTFSATPLAAIWCGLEPYFVDINEENWCMDQEKVQALIEELGEQIAVVIPYATFGTFMDLTYYNQLEERGYPVVIDAAASFGCIDQNGVQFGSGFLGSVVYSFHATKSFGLGEGGFVYSQRRQLIERIRASANFGYHGSRESKTLGLNGKMSEFTSAIGLATLDEYEDKIQQRQNIREWYAEEIVKENMRLKGWDLQKTRGRVPYQFMSMLCPADKTSDTFIDKLRENGIQANNYFSPACHQQLKFSSYAHTNLDITESVCCRILSLPLWVGMNQGVVSRVISVLSGN
ncbi:aminotransferase class I/II-fold pyridoxal phosphate-dependent enzyme [Brevibacillus panacihumi]|uniref:aminotransferase class I/II-fold pyridoxal phosphate-dependent enzyme n=1 Tax=Brevibacillus panacihumi TaxID=497735 RepID=UPI003D1C361A